MTVVEQVAKLMAIAQNADLSEGNVQHVFALGRRLVERVPEADRPNFDLVKFYGDWTVHSKIDRSRAGAGVLQRVADIVFEQKQKTDTDKMIRDMIDALSFERTRQQLNALVTCFHGPADLFTPDQWRVVVSVLVEIISSTPLTIVSDKRFLSFLNAIRSKPVKGTSVVEAIELVKVSSTTFKKDAPADQITFCIKIETTDTTKFIVPLAK